MWKPRESCEDVNETNSHIESLFFAKFFRRHALPKNLFFLLIFN